MLFDIVSARLPGAVIGLPALADSFAAAVDRDPGSLRAGLLSRRADERETAPKGLATARDAAALLEQLGYHVEERLGPRPGGFDAVLRPLMGVSLLHQVWSGSRSWKRELRETTSSRSPG